MFYSHEVLTSRKYGVATIWLVATLGSKSTLKKVNRKAILDVNVPKAVETIITPEAPMALRLQSNLLFGVSRVYSQQCGYVLADAQAAQNNIRTLLKVVRSAELDPEAGRARPEALLLEDDPTFLPDLAFAPLDFDLSRLDAFISGGSQTSSSLSPHTARTTPQSDQTGLILPSSGTGGVGDIGGFVVDGSDRFSALAGAHLLGEDDGFLPEADFTFDEEGNLLDLGGMRAASAAPPGATRRSTTAPAVRAPTGPRSVLEEQLRDDDVPMDLDLPPVGNDYDVPPDAPAFKTPVHGRPQQSSSVLASDELETSSSAAAPQRRRKVRKIIAMDTTTELHNSDLSRWNNEYLDNMADITSTKMNYKAPLQAKLNAEHWILGAGLGGVGNGIGHGNVKSPLDVFSGASLFKALTGRDLAVTGLKRDHDATTEDETDVDQRRVRRRTEDPEELGRGDGMAFEDDGGFRGMDDDIEMAREAGEALADESTAMPWNIAAPQRGSSVGRGRPGSVTGFLASAAGPSSVGGPLTGLGGPPGSVSRLGPRLLGASPLIGRSRPLALGGDEGPSGTSGRGDDIGLGAGILGDEERDDFELYGPAAGVDTQTAGETQWQRAALDTESFNFLDFIETAIQERTQAGDDKADTVLFEELLPPNSNSKVVAAQGLLHVLSLGTKNLIAAKQTEHLGDIELRLLPAASTV